MFFGFAFLTATNVFAIELNLDYPSTPMGSTVTSQSTVPQYLKYIFEMGMFLGGIALIFSLTLAGVYYFLSPALPSMRAKAKDHISGSLSGFLILLLVYLIITTINPDLSFFRLHKLQPNVPVSPTPTPQTPGVYFYKTSGCSGDPLIKTSSIYDLEDKKRNTRSAKIIQDSVSSNSYISILFESSKFTGKCFYINPNLKCNSNIEPFASSASIYMYNFYPSSGGVIFFREPFYNAKGGYLQVSGAETQNNKYVKALADLTYMKNPNGNRFDPDNCTVPKEKMDCVAWDDTGLCKKRKCPSLSEGNIGSIGINGNYVVLLVYFGPDDKPAGPWSLCQSFPTPDDRIRMGPNKVKWEDISNQNRIPNYAIILPVIDNTNPEVNSIESPKLNP